MLYEDWCSAGQLTTEAYPINEDWISDVAHFIGDVTAAVADVTVPGSGAVIDFINMLSYFVEAHFSSDSIEQTKLIISGLIQAFAILDPINAIAVGLKTGLNKVFSFFATKTPAAAAAARVAAREVESGLTLILNGLQGLATKLTTAISGSTFTQALKWLSSKLGITSAVNWIKTFITQTAVPFIKTFLTKLRDTFNPGKIGATTAASEFNSVLARNIAKLAVNQSGATQIHSKVDTFASNWYAASSAGSNRSYTDPRIMQTDATYVAPKPYLKGLK
jgi:hypothetical protein